MQPENFPFKLPVNFSIDTKRNENHKQSFVEAAGKYSPLQAIVLLVSHYHALTCALPSQPRFLSAF